MNNRIKPCRNSTSISGINTLVEAFRGRQVRVFGYDELPTDRPAIMAELATATPCKKKIPRDTVK